MIRLRDIKAQLKDIEARQVEQGILLTELGRQFGVTQKSAQAMADRTSKGKAA
jgi:hypothetical protein